MADLSLFAAGEAVFVPTMRGVMPALVVSTIDIGDSQGYVMVFPTTKMIGEYACAYKSWIAVGQMEPIMDLAAVEPKPLRDQLVIICELLKQARPVGHVYYQLTDPIPATG